MSLPTPLLQAQTRATPATPTVAIPLTLPTPPQSAEAVVREAEQLQRRESYRQARQQFQQAQVRRQRLVGQVPSAPHWDPLVYRA